MPHEPMPEAIASVRVLHLLPHQGVGGLQRSVIDLVRHERMDGATDEIVLTERALDTDGDFMAPATPVHFLGLSGARLAARAARLADLAASRGARAIHAYTCADLLLAAAACGGDEGPRLGPRSSSGPPRTASSDGGGSSAPLKPQTSCSSPPRPWRQTGGPWVANPSSGWPR